MHDSILNLLNTTYRIPQDTRFTPASEVVLRGADLKETGNQKHGTQVYIATFEPPHSIDPALLKTGQHISLGSVESFSHCELRCWEAEGFVRIGLFGQNGQAISRQLGTAVIADQVSYDEGSFTWFSPREYYGTPWSDNDPAVCQVVTVKRLRAFARVWNSGKV